MAANDLARPRDTTDGRAHAVFRALALSLFLGAVLILSSCAMLRKVLPPNKVTAEIAAKALPSASINNVSVTEGNAGTKSVSFAVTLSSAPIHTVKVHYTSANGTAHSPDDFHPVSGTTTFARGRRTATITVVVKSERVVEPNESFSVKLSAPINATIARSQGTATIINDDPTPSLAIGNLAVVEGNSGTTNAVFSVTLSAPSSSTVTIDYATSDGSTSAPSDYTSASGTLVFPPLTTLKNVTIPVKGDSLFEADETFFVDLFSPDRAIVVDGTAQGTILDNDLPTVSIGDVTVTEGNAGTVDAVFAVTLPAAADHLVTVDYATQDGSATAPGDYSQDQDTLVFDPGVTSLTVTIAVNGDAQAEADESFYVHLANAAGASIADAFGRGAILNDDIAVPSLSVASPSALAEGNAGTANAVFTVTLSSASASTVTVDYATADGSATASSDYTSAGGTLTYAPGQTTKLITIAVSGDTVNENDETLLVELSSPVNATIGGTGVGTGTITNDDTPPTLTIAAPGATNEGNSGTTNLVFTVTLSAPSAVPVTVNYTTVDGSATEPADYTAHGGTLTYTPGQTSQQIVVLVKGDSTVETNETLTVNLSNPGNATVAGTGIGTATITNDDTLPTLTMSAPAATNEGNSGTTNFVFTVTLSAVSANTVTVDYASADGSAVASSDYTAVSGTLTFAAGQTNKQITVLVAGDTTVETNETFTVNLANPANATIAGTGIGTATVNNDDTPPTLTVAAPAATNEGNAGTTNFVFTVTLSAPSSSTVTVDFTTVDGSAAAPSDYAAQSGTVSFGAGQTSKPITILVAGDATVETNETFTVNLANPANATIATTSATATITNDDTLPTLTIAAPAAASEGNSGTTNFVFTVTLSATSTSTVTVDYASADGSATAGVDYTAVSGTLTFAAGQTNKQITVLVNGDTTVETNETLTVNLANPTNATVAGTGIGTATVNNDDTLPGLTLAAPAATNEGNLATTNFVFTVTLSAPSASTVTVDYTSADGSAAAASDYAAQSGTVSFAAGQTSKLITILVNGDTTVETNETFTVNLSNPANATITTASATATITNDDTLPTLTITSPAAVTEGNAGTTVNAVFTVTLSAISANTVTVDYVTADGSANGAAGDYTTASGTLTFAAGQTSQQIAVIVKGDTLNEINETFTLNLSNAANATIAGTGIGTETITNDDAVPTLAINNVTQAEGGGGTTNFVFTVTLSTASGLPVTVDFATVAGTAVVPGDFAAQSGTLTFTPGQTTKTITIAVVADAVNEANEAFTVVLSNPANATITTATGTGTITNDD